MKFTTSALVAAVMASSASAFAPVQTPTRLPSTAVFSTTEEETSAQPARQLRKKDERRRMMKSEQFHRNGFKEVRDKVEDVMQEQFKSELVQEFKDNKYVVERDGVKVYLAKVRNTKCNGSLWVLFW